MPRLAGSVLAETDPSDLPPSPSRLPELTPAQQALRAVRVAEMTTAGTRSVRRMPSMPEVNPVPGRRNPALAARSAEAPASRPASPDEDSQARQVRARTDDDPVAVEAKPRAAIVAEPESAPSRSLAPPESEAAARPVAAPVPPEETAPPVAAQPEPAPAEADGPPPIEPPATEPADHRGPRPAPIEPKAAVDPDTGGDPTLAGRPRLARVGATRDHLPADLPPVTFPRSYYTSSEVARLDSRPKIDPETRPARWTWTPKLLRRLRGEDTTYFGSKRREADAQSSTGGPEDAPRREQEQAR